VTRPRDDGPVINGRDAQRLGGRPPVAPIRPARGGDPARWWAFAPVVAILPVAALAITVFWLPIRLVWDVPWGWFAGGYAAAALLLFLRPVQSLVLASLMGARRPTRAERASVETSWRSVLQAARIDHDRYLLRVLPSDEINAFACGGHLVVVTSYAIETLPRDELSGVLAHELSHHLGAHTIALTLYQWLSLPVLTLARVGFFLRNVATAARDTWARNRAGLAAVTDTLAFALMALSWVFLSGLIVANALSNQVAANSEFDADRRAMEMGFGKPLSMALTRCIADEPPRLKGWRGALQRTHPPARTRVARISVALRYGPDVTSHP
jgi:Zn-dependent protease with chaperone function